MNQEQYEKIKELSKEYIIEEGKLLPSPFGGYMLGVYGDPGFGSSQQQFDKVSVIRGRLLEAFELLKPSDEESKKIKQCLERDEDVIETRERVEAYLIRRYKTLPKVMKTCNDIIKNSFSEDQIENAEIVKKAVGEVKK